MTKRVLVELVKAGKPLVEAWAGLVEGVNLDEIIRELNRLGDDLSAAPYFYNKMDGGNDLTIDATPEALERIFGWEIRRFSRVEGLYVWEEVNAPKRFPECLEGKVTGTGLAQPGACDDGQPYP